MSDPSPFLPGTKVQFSWDSTSLGWLKECDRKYEYSMIEGWRSKHESVHLRYGQLYHSGLENFDKQRALGVGYDDALRDTVWLLLKETWDEDGPWAPDHNSKTRETLIRSVIWYIEQFKDDPAQTVILANGKPAVELSFRWELDYGPVQRKDDGTLDTDGKKYLLCGHLDRVVNFTGGTYVMDRKTTGSALSSHYFDGFDPDNQMSLYSLAAKVIYKTPVQGVILDAAQIMVGFTRFGRGFTYRTEARNEEWLKDIKVHLHRNEENAARDYWPMNDKSCGNYGGCVFRGVCSKDPSVRQKFLEADFVKVPWNPLVPR